MSTIVYKNIKGALFATDFDESVGDTLKLELDGGKEGSVILADKRFPVVNGECTVELFKIEDGIYRPVFISEMTRTVMDGFEKRGRIIRLLPVPDRKVRAFFKEYSATEERLLKAEEAIARLFQAIESATIF